MKYVNFDLEAFEYKKPDSKNVEQFKVRVSKSPVGEMAEAESVTLTADVRDKVVMLENRAFRQKDMIAFGEALAAVLFPSSVRDFLNRSRASLGVAERLRIRLKLNVNALADLPWEYVYIAKPNTPTQQKGADGFLALDSSISIVRYEVMGQRLVSLDPVGDGPLRIVVLLSNPKSNDFADLDLAQERRNIEKALLGLDALQPEYFPDATPDTLQDALVRSAHIFHFAGHGEFREDSDDGQGNGYVILTDDVGQAAPFSAARLALNLAGRGVRLAFLGACEVGRCNGHNAWTGVVPALAKAGIPAIVGMQFKVDDANAIMFSKRFYGALAAGQSIDAAVTDGRLGIFNRGNDDERDWGVPVVYLRLEQDDSTLFPRGEATSGSNTGRGSNSQNASHSGRGNIVDTGGGTYISGNVNVGDDFVGRDKIVVNLPTTSTSVPPPGPPSSSEPLPDKVVLRNFMVKNFGSGDLEVLCADITRDIGEPVDLETVGGSSKTSQVLNLIQWMDRRGFYTNLVVAVQKARPQLKIE